MPSQWQPHAGILRASPARQVCREGSTGPSPRPDRGILRAMGRGGGGEGVSAEPWKMGWPKCPCGENRLSWLHGFFSQTRWFEGVCHCGRTLATHVWEPHCCREYQEKEGQLRQRCFRCL